MKYKDFSIIVGFLFLLQNNSAYGITPLDPDYIDKELKPCMAACAKKAKGRACAAKTAALQRSDRASQERADEDNPPTQDLSSSRKRNFAATLSPLAEQPVQKKVCEERCLSHCEDEKHLSEASQRIDEWVTLSTLRFPGQEKSEGGSSVEFDDICHALNCPNYSNRSNCSCPSGISVMELPPPLYCMAIVRENKIILNPKPFIIPYYPNDGVRVLMESQVKKVFGEGTLEELVSRAKKLEEWLGWFEEWEGKLCTKKEKFEQKLDAFIAMCKTGQDNSTKGHEITKVAEKLNEYKQILKSLSKFKTYIGQVKEQVKVQAQFFNWEEYLPMF